MISFVSIYSISLVNFDNECERVGLIANYSFSQNILTGKYKEEIHKYLKNYLPVNKTRIS